MPKKGSKAAECDITDVEDVDCGGRGGGRGGLRVHPCQICLFPNKKLCHFNLL